MTFVDHAAASVRVRITAVASLFVLLVMAMGSVVIVGLISHTVDHSLIDSAGQDAEAIDAQLARGVTPPAAATTGRNDVVVQLLDKRGAVIASDRPDQLALPLRTTVGVTSSEVVPGLHDDFTVVARKARSKGTVSLIVVGRSTEQRDETRAETARALAVAVPLIAATLALILWLSIGRALRPVEVMRQEADQITATHLPRRLAVPAGADEIPRLAHTLNEMLDRIDEGQKAQRQFVSDASHELRSPLAVLRQTAEVGRAHPDRVRTVDLADDVLATSARLEELVSALLLLARLESHTTGPGEPVDVDDVVLTEVSRARNHGTDVTLDASAVSAGRTTGSTVLLGQVVRNLLANAVRHARDRVEISLSEEGGTVVLRVDDDGGGIAPEDREAVFERFVRLDEARARDEGGTGLGLAIVRTIVTSLDGSVRVTQSPLGGARFEVLLPASPL
ncbi:MAG: ATP-binding region, ATPase domain protein [Marmoricola sp.]|nr:ATP-binding region, ATPase domain protein [Marmoricola sp.]